MFSTSSTVTSLPDHFVDVLQQQAMTAPERAAFVWRSDELSEEGRLAYGPLLARAQRVAAGLQARCAAGDRVVLLYPPGLEFIVSFLGCLVAGLVAVPICPPRRQRPSPGIDRIVRNAEPSVVLSTVDYGSKHAEWFREIPALLQRAWLTLEQLAGLEASWTKPRIDDDTLAFLQYTSGTTGTPKGVMVSHGNLRHNAATIRKAIGPQDHPQRVFWLPMYHDLGLIGGMLQTVFDGATSDWIPPSTFLRRPMSWLELISRTGASFSGAPDFAYALCVRRSTPETREGLDLSGWTVACSGAELVRPSTIEAFTRAFAPCGFRRETLQPGYGLAEATLVVSHTPKESAPVTVSIDGSAVARNEVCEVEDSAPQSRSFTSCGPVAAMQRVVVVDPVTGFPCCAGRVGEIWVHGPNVARGYYNDPAATAETFHAKIPGDDRCYLRTGDLGFWLGDQLCIAGRLKELIVMRGRNLFPQDIERVIAECPTEMQGAASAVISVELLGSERLIVIQEFPRNERHLDFDRIGRDIRMAIGRECGVEVFDLLFVREGRIPRTTSGKTRRLQCREDYLAECFEPVARWKDRPHAADAATLPAAMDVDAATGTRSADEIRAWLLQRIGTRLDVPAEELNQDQAFSEMGLGSLDVVLICDDFENWLGTQLAPTTLFNYPTIASLAEHLGSGEAPQVLPLVAEATRDPLREEIERWSPDELEAFIAQEAAKWAAQSHRRAA